MEITSPNSLWKDYDVTALPFNLSALTDKTKNGARMREFYFDGYTTVDGKVRAFMSISESASNKGIVLYLPNGEASDDDRIPSFLAENGYTVAQLDFAGSSETNPRYTLYPASLDACNLRAAETFSAPDDALNSCWYVWTCIARRAIHVIRSLYQNEPIFALGKGLGGSTVYKLSAFNDGLSACATLLNIIPDVNGSGNQIINYRAALDNSAYASVTVIPMYMAVCSNAEDSSLDKMSELAQSTTALKCFRIVERAFTDGIRVTYNQLTHFFDACVTGSPSIPTITVKPVNSENNLYFNINIANNTTTGQEKIDLYAAFCIENPTNRNWTNIRTVWLGGSEYLANVVVLQDDKPVYVFVNMTDDEDNVVSSTVLLVTPKSLGIPAQTEIKRRLIYDGSMGKDVWMSPHGGEVAVESGPFGIDGVCGSGNRLITFKPGDLLYRAEGDALLQIIINGKCRDLKVNVYDGTESYFCNITLPNADEWHKFTLSHSDFKGVNGPLNDWSKVIMFDISADDKFIVSSVLWV